MKMITGRPLPVLITRPEPQAGRFAQELRARFPDLQPVNAPLMAREFLRPASPQGSFSALILTSETGAEAAGLIRDSGTILPDLALCVGPRSASAARQAGFQALSADGAAADLLDLIRARAPEGRLLYLHGEDRAADIAGALRPEGFVIDSLVAYRQRALPLPAAARALLLAPAPVLLPLFSPRSARLFVAALPKDHLAPLLPVVISANARAALPDWLQDRAETADHPDLSGMMQAIHRVISSPSP